LNRWSESMAEVRVSGAKWIEIFGLLGVVGSLAFVGVEIRQSTAVARGEAYQSFVSEINSVNLVVASDPMLSAAWLTSVTRGTEELSEPDRQRVAMIASAYLRTYEGLLNQVSTGVLPDDALGLMSRGTWDVPIFQGLWSSRVFRSFFSDEFNRYFEATHGFAH